MKNVAVVGLGSIAHRHRKNLKKLFPDVIVMAVSSSGKVNGKNTEYADFVFSSIDELFHYDIDFGIVASPATFHLVHAKKLFRYKVPILIEKPISDNLMDAKAIESYIVENNITAYVGYCLRFLPSAERVKDILSCNDMGNIFTVIVNVGQYLPDWRKKKNYKSSVSGDKSLGGGVLLELSHEFDYLQWFFGELTPCFSYLRNSHDLNLDVEEVADLTLLSDSGVLCSVHLDFLQKEPYRKCTVIGENGVLEWNLIDNSISLANKYGSSIVYADKEWDKNNMYIYMLKNLFNSRTPERCKYDSVNSSVKVVELVDKIKANSVVGVKI